MWKNALTSLRAAALAVFAVTAWGAPADAAVQLRFQLTAGTPQVSFTPDVYTTYDGTVTPLPSLPDGTPGVDFAVGRTSVEKMKVAYDGGITPLAGFSSTSLTPAVSKAFPITINRGVYAGALDNGGSLTILCSGSASWVNGTVANYNDAAGTFTLQVGSTAVGGLGIAGQTAAAGGGACANWQLALNLPQYASSNAVSNGGTTVWTLTTGTSLSNWDFRLVNDVFVFNGTLPKYQRLTVDNTLFDIGHQGNIGLGPYFSGTAPYFFQNSEVQFNWQNGILGTAKIAADSLAIAGGRVMTVDAVPAAVAAALVDRAGGNGAVRVLNSSDPTALATTHVLNVSGNQLTLDWAHSNSDSATSGSSVFYKDNLKNQTLTFFVIPETSTMFSGQYVGMDHSRIHTSNDFFIGNAYSVNTVGTGFGISDTNSVVSADGTVNTGQHGDYNQYYSVNVDAPMVEHNVVYRYNHILGVTTSGISVARDQFINSVNGTNVAPREIYNNIIIGDDYAGLSNPPYYLNSNGRGRIIGTQQMSNGNTRIYWARVGGDQFQVLPGDPWQVRGLPGFGDYAPHVANITSGFPSRGVTAVNTVQTHDASGANATTLTLNFNSSSGANSIGYGINIGRALVDDPLNPTIMTRVTDLSYPVVNGVTLVQVTVDPPIPSSLNAGTLLYQALGAETDLPWPGVAFTGPFTTTTTAAAAAKATKLYLADTSKVGIGMQVDAVGSGSTNIAIANPSSDTLPNFRRHIVAFDATSVTLDQGTLGAVPSGQTVVIGPTMTGVDTGSKHFYNNYYKLMNTSLFYTFNSAVNQYAMSIHDMYRFDNTGKITGPVLIGNVDPETIVTTTATEINRPLVAPTAVTMAAVANDNTKLQVTYTSAAGSLGTQYTLDGVVWSVLGSDNRIGGLAANTNYSVRLRSMIGPDSLGVPQVAGAASVAVTGKTGQ